ncbi:MAG: hypothetical protein LBN35_02035 [Clostridiales Family XIII bacterium]|jgi:hypothetical protein|nr:hypothetical protein [Clostridiales Family XIII bacterium]
MIGAVPAVLLALLVVFAACNLSIISELFDNFVQSKPDAERTITTRAVAVEQIMKAVEAGDSKIVLDIACREDEVESYVKDIDPFFGGANAYRIESTFDDIELEEGGPASFVSRIEYQLEQSPNWYALKLMQDPEFTVPEGVAADVSLAASALAKAVPKATAKIYGADGPEADLSSYDLVLKAHDWLVANIKYDEDMEATSKDNSSYGAFIGKKTLCQGYAEALELILRYATDVPVRMEIGEGDSGDGIWIGHAWNLVQLDEVWYQIDTTFDDQIGNKKGEVDHYYFGQTDNVMKQDHKWTTELWPEADGQSFLYYRNEGLYTKNIDEAVAVIKKVLDKGPTKKKKSVRIEFVADGYKIDSGDMQFIYRDYPEVEDIYKSAVKIDGRNVLNLKIDYE